MRPEIIIFHSDFCHSSEALRCSSELVLGHPAGTQLGPSQTAGVSNLGCTVKPCLESLTQEKKHGLLKSLMPGLREGLVGKSTHCSHQGHQLCPSTHNCLSLQFCDQMPFSGLCDFWLWTHLHIPHTGITESQPLKCLVQKDSYTCQSWKSFTSFLQTNAGSSVMWSFYTYLYK